MAKITVFSKKMEKFCKNMVEIRQNWTIEEMVALYEQPLFELMLQAQRALALYHQPGEVQVCHLISVKTGGCPEDCKYCAQSSKYQTFVTPQKLMKYDQVIEAAKQAVAQGATRICMGAAWREVKDNQAFDEIVQMVKGVAGLGVEVCCTLGMIKEHQVEKLKQAGLYAYNHNLDTSERYYPSIITTRTYQDRLQTLDIIQKKGISACCGCIMGLGETPSDRLEFLLTLSKRNPHPESVPINQLTAVPGTPLESQQKLPIWDVLRMIALTRIVLPKSMVRISCGRENLTYEQQALCFFAGANSIFLGEKLLTVGNPSIDADQEMLQLLGLRMRGLH